MLFNGRTITGVQAGSNSLHKEGFLAKKTVLVALLECH